MPRKPRYIDANKLINKKQYQFQIQGGAFPKSGFFIRVDDVLRAPTVDVEPVRHGMWGEYETHPLAHSLDGFPCSVCGLHQDDIRGLYYCPNCGAKMMDCDSDG